MKTPLSSHRALYVYRNVRNTFPRRSVDEIFKEVQKQVKGAEQNGKVFNGVNVVIDGIPLVNPGEFVDALRTLIARGRINPDTFLPLTRPNGRTFARASRPTEDKPSFEPELDETYDDSQSANRSRKIFPDELIKILRAARTHEELNDVDFSEGPYVLTWQGRSFDIGTRVKKLLDRKVNSTDTQRSTIRELASPPGKPPISPTTKMTPYK